MKSQTIKLDNPVYINSGYSSVGSLEGKGPLGKCFDFVSDDATFGAKSWEQAENMLVKNTVSGVMTKAAITPDDVDYIFAGDLLNQCVGTSFALCDYDIPFYGLYGACSTFIEGMGLAALFVNAGYGQTVIATASSHFCSSEKQYRFPLEYGGVRTPTSQWTVTGSGAAVIKRSGINSPKITHVITGKMVNKGVCDANNMGAAMAPAAADTIKMVLSDTGFKPCDFDVIVTGDLGDVGSDLLKQLLIGDGIDITPNHADCGSMIFNNNVQGTHAGGSGCGCIASVFCGNFLPMLINKKINRGLFVATGALMSTTTCGQGEPIIGIAHGIIVESQVDVQ